MPKKHILSCLCGCPSCLQPGLRCKGGSVREQPAVTSACNPGVWAHVTHLLTVSNTHPEPQQEHRWPFASPPGVPSCGYGCCCLSSGLLDSVFKHCTLACENVSAFTQILLTYVNAFCKIGKMKTPRAWAPWRRGPQWGLCSQTLDWALELGKALWVWVWTLLPVGGISQSPLSLYNLCHDLK